jgi:hypothetical protein
MEPKIEYLQNKDADTVKTKYQDKSWYRWTYGCYCEETGNIQVCLDTILKTYELFGREQPEEYLSREISDTVTHEFLHHLNPKWTENQVFSAISNLFGGDLN